MLRRPLILLALLLAHLPVGAAPHVVATVMPIHSLAAAVMEGVAEPHLLLPPGASPHSYTLVPSDARALAQADLIIWIGPGLEQFLAKPLRSLAAQAIKLELDQVDGILLLDADEHHHDAADHAYAHYDPHLWLDPLNAVQMLDAMAEQLAALDPDNAAAYRRNASQYQAQLRALDVELRHQLEPVQGVPFMVFHDAYRYFEQRYGLFDAGALTLSPERLPGARTVIAAHNQVKERNIRCVFREPQFEPRLAETVARGTQAQLAVLDPLGAELAPGPSAYPQLLRNLSQSLLACLAR